MDFTFNEYADMYMMYGFSNGNANMAEQEYRVRFPNRRHPTGNVFRRLDLRLRETGSFYKRNPNAGRPRQRRTLQLEEEILDSVYEDPSVSTRQLASTFNIPSNKTVHSVLRENLLYPYHITKVQPLYENDNVHRLNFCHSILNRIYEDGDFLRSVLWTDESMFTRDGVLNIHNFYHWADENPHAIREYGHQRKFSVNVWLGIINHQVVGPIYLPNRLDANGYFNVLEQVIDEMPLNIRRNMFYMHDGAPAHFARNVREWLDEHFPNRWIGRGGPILWPARSPDLNPLDFFVWGFIKDKVYATPPQNADEVRGRINAAVLEITPERLERVIQTIPRRLQLCLQTDGHQFEQMRR